MTQAGRGWSTASKTMDLTSSGSSQIPVFTDVALPSAYLGLYALMISGLSIITGIISASYLPVRSTSFSQPACSREFIWYSTSVVPRQGKSGFGRPIRLDFPAARRTPLVLSLTLICAGYFCASLSLRGFCSGFINQVLVQ